MEWEGLFSYVFPPHQIIVQVLNKFSQTKVYCLILIVTTWLKQMELPNPWNLSQVVSIPLPYRDNIPSCMETVKESLKDKGCTVEAAKRIMVSQT